ncbi:pyridoxamine 5'-phosphate oxidase family protein [Streptomyces malaysiensis]|uniref:Pyridoxamine 5'-phosphate oxidase family protein n=1 Tax=Streptomyces malaysiensis TaxID=92644 RepID=A0A7X6B1D5_STRMQ|nr:pyridoxamine 5'-phosphate oxidase family protein [Streptomyces malaysiensis]NIY69785.1 hypothetical protein [Streptomyces malaysiensis]
MTLTERSFSAVESEFFQYISDIAYATMITVDKKGRPRARILLPIWEVVDGRPVGWLAAYKTPVKSAHLANNPHTTYSYWNPRQNAVFIDSVSRWVEDEPTKRHAWELYRKGSPPGVGYDPGVTAILAEIGAGTTDPVGGIPLSRRSNLSPGHPTGTARLQDLRGGHRSIHLAPRKHGKNQCRPAAPHHKGRKVGQGPQGEDPAAQ